MIYSVCQTNILQTHRWVSGGGAGIWPSSLLLPGITRLVSPQTLYDESDETAYLVAIKELNSSKNSVLIISDSYAWELNVAGYLNNHKSLGINTSTMNSYKSYKPFINSLNKLLAIMGNRKLIIIGQVPGSKYIPMNCIGNLKWFNSYDNCLLEDSISNNIGAINVNKILAEYAAKTPNVYFVNPYSVFCKAKYCMSVNNNGTLFYSGGWHLSKVGSVYFIHHVRRKILAILASDTNLLLKPDNR